MISLGKTLGAFLHRVCLTFTQPFFDELNKFEGKFNVIFQVCKEDTPKHPS